MKIKYIKKPEVFFVSNESFEEIAKKFDCSVSSLKSYNKLDSIYNGSILAIPSHQTQTKKVYVVKPADTLEKIAIKLNVKKQDLIKENNINKVFIGQILFY